MTTLTIRLDAKLEKELDRIAESSDARRVKSPEKRFAARSPWRAFANFARRLCRLPKPRAC
jgi:predicted transcriptional regulator